MDIEGLELSSLLLDITCFLNSESRSLQILSALLDLLVVASTFFLGD